VAIMEKYKDDQTHNTRIHEFMEANGLKAENYKNVNDLFYHHNIQSGGETEKKIVGMWNSPSDDGKAMRLFSKWNEFQARAYVHELTPEQKTSVDDRVHYATKFLDPAKGRTWESEREMFELGKYSDTPQKYRELLTAREKGELLQFRKGDMKAPVLSFTSDPEGARSGSSVFANPNIIKTFDQLKNEGYSLLAGTRGMIGNTSAQEQEHIWIKNNAK